MKSLFFSGLLAALVAVACVSYGVQGERPLDFGAAKSYAVLAGSTVTSTGTVGTVINGNIGVFPGSATTGFPPAVVNGEISTYGTSGNAQGDLTTAYNFLAGKPFTTTLSGQDLGGMTLLPGVYKFDATATLNGILTLDAHGDSSAIWTFQIGSTFMVGQTSSIIFKNSIGAADYVYWQVGTTATIAVGVPMIGNILALHSIILNDGVTVQGRCLARNAEVTLDRTVITIPAIVSFLAQQTVTGISLQQYNSNPDVNEATLKDAIAHTMSGVGATNIKNFKVRAGPTSVDARVSLRGIFVPVTTSARALATDSIILNYNVVASTTKTAEQLQDQLNTAVQDGSFDHLLQAAATDQGATDLQNANSESVDTQTVIIPDEASAEKSATLSTGAIIGIVIGGFFALLLIAGLFYYFCAGHSATVSVHKGGGGSTQNA